MPYKKYTDYPYPSRGMKTEREAGQDFPFLEYVYVFGRADPSVSLLANLESRTENTKIYDTALSHAKA